MKTIRIKKILACLLTTSCLFASINTVAFANDNITESYIDSDYGVYSLYLSSCSSELTISGTSAECYSKAIGNSSVTQIIGDMYLMKYSSSNGWQDIDAWRLQQSGNYYTNTKTKTGLSSGSYRLRTEFTVTASNGATETVTAYSGVKVVSTTP